MPKFKIMNVLLSDDAQFVNNPALLCRSTRPWVSDSANRGTWRLKGPGRHDFMTFFNALSIQKWREYTVATSYGIHLELKGAACVVTQTRAGAFSYYSQPVESNSVTLVASDEWQELDLALSYTKDDILLSFAIECEGDLCLRNSFYFVEVEESALRPVELALCTTTFKKEDFITSNIALVRREVLGSGERIAGHFRMHVVDNGRTLDASALEGGGVEIHPNPNVGGAGGFARGMMEAMGQQPRATHVLLMDDDVLISAESIIRTYNLLSIVNEEYAEAFVSGAMMNMDEPAVRWEEMGYIGWDGAFHPVKQKEHMDGLHEIVGNESYDIPSYLPGCDDQNQHYAAWWYCVIPMTQIERNGLPLPIFVRGDDVEYSRRCAPKFITMNGICIWHLSFHMRYNAAQERYQMTRNCLIDQAASDFAPLSDFDGQMRKSFEMEMSKFNYKNAELILRGIEDFLKGPEWIMQPVAHQAFMDANRDAEQLVPIEQLADELAALGVDLGTMSDWNVWRDRPFGRKDRKLFQLTGNGQTLLSSYTEKGKVVVIDAAGWADCFGKYQHAEVIVAVDMPNGKAVVRRADPERYKELVARWKADMKQLKERREELARAYHEARPMMTSVEFWKGYLGL